MNGWRLSTPLRVGLWMGLSALGFAGLIAVVRHLSADMPVVVISFLVYITQAETNRARRAVA